MVFGWLVGWLVGCCYVVLYERINRRGKVGERCFFIFILSSIIIVCLSRLDDGDDTLLRSILGNNVSSSKTVNNPSDRNNGSVLSVYVYECSFLTNAKRIRHILIQLSYSSPIIPAAL